jgi:hypothetical protein
MSKVMEDHRIDKLSTLLDANQTHLNVEKRNEISIERETNVNSCSSTIKIEPLFIPKSNRLKVYSSTKKYKCETCKKPRPN